MKDFDIRRTCLAILVITLIFSSTGKFLSAQSPTSETEKESIVEKKLETEISFQQKDDKFSKLVAHLVEACSLKIKIHQSAMDAGLANDDLISFDYEKTRLRTALTLFLDKYECTYRIKDDILILMTRDEAQNHLRMKLYPCRDILKWIEDADPELKQKVNKSTDKATETQKAKTIFSADTRHELTFLIENMVAPDSWEGSEGLGTHRILNGILIVSQTEEVHSKINKLLKQLRKTLPQGR